MYVTGVQCSVSQLLKVVLHIVIIKYWLYSWVVPHIFAAGFIPSGLCLLLPCLCLPFPPPLSLPVTTSLFFYIWESASFLLYSLTSLLYFLYFIYIYIYMKCHNSNKANNKNYSLWKLYHGSGILPILSLNPCYFPPCNEGLITSTCFFFVSLIMTQNMHI